MKLVTICMTLFLIIIPVSGFAGNNLILNVTPGIFLYSPDADGFRVTDGDKTGEVDGYFTNKATLTAGVGFDTPKLFADLTGGVGYLYNSAFTAEMLLADLAIRFKIRRDELTAGPHISVIKYSPKWDGDADISMSGSTGFMAGLSLTMGSKEFSIAASLDYLNASFDVEPPGVSLDGGALDISGLAFQLGILMRF